MKVIVTFYCTDLMAMVPKDTLEAQMKTAMVELFNSNKQLKMVFTKADVQAVVG